MTCFCCSPGIWRSWLCSRWASGASAGFRPSAAAGTASRFVAVGAIETRGATAGPGARVAGRRGGGRPDARGRTGGGNRQLTGGPGRCGPWRASDPQRAGRKCPPPATCQPLDLPAEAQGQLPARQMAESWGIGRGESLLVLALSLAVSAAFWLAALGQLRQVRRHLNGGPVPAEPPNCSRTRQKNSRCAGFAVVPGRRSDHADAVGRPWTAGDRVAATACRFGR